MISENLLNNRPFQEVFNMCVTNFTDKYCLACNCEQYVFSFFQNFINSLKGLCT